jgi:hypothetical protein
MSHTFDLSLVDMARVLITSLKEADTEIRCVGRARFSIFILNFIFDCLLALL